MGTHPLSNYRDSILLGVGSAFIAAVVGLSIARGSYFVAAILLLSVYGLLLATRPVVLYFIAVGLVIMVPYATYVGFPQIAVSRVAALLPIVALVLGAARFRSRLTAADVVISAFVCYALVSWVATGPAGEFQVPIATLLPVSFYAWGRLFGSRDLVVATMWVIALAGTAGALSVLYEAFIVQRPLFADPTAYYWKDTGEYLFRPGGVYGSPPGAAVVLSMVCACALALIIRSEGSRRFVAIGCFGISLLAAGTTFTRGSLVALIIVLPAFWFFVLTPRSRRNAAAFGVMLVIGIAILVAPSWTGSETVQRGVIRPDTLQERQTYWKLAIPVISESPQDAMIGHGFNVLLTAREETDTRPVQGTLASSGKLIQYGPHNQYLRVAVELGVVGLALFLAWFLLPLIGGLRESARCSDASDRYVMAALCAAVASFLIAGLVGDHIQYGPGLALASLCVGMLESRREANRRDRLPSPRQASRLGEGPTPPGFNPVSGAGTVDFHRS